MYKNWNSARADRMTSSPLNHVFVDADRIALELRRGFGLELADLEDVGTAIYQGFIQVSALHPKGFNGTNAWASGTARLRAIQVPRGWVPEDPHGQPRITAPGGKLSITVSSGNADTGVPHRMPQTRNDKGSQTARSVHYNAAQGLLFPVAEPAAVTRLRDEGQALWMLLYYIDLEAGHLRMELSRPRGMSEADKINDWSVRYILPPMPLVSDVGDIAPDSLPDIDFDVLPKQS
jgi:hypothetical protein